MRDSFSRNWRRAADVSGYLAMLALLAAAAAAPPAAPAAAEPDRDTQTVTIENMQFTPARVSVHRGERIVWINKDLFPHTVSSDNKDFDSGPINAGSSWSYKADKVGEYAYSCTLHPTMKAILSVQ